MDVASCAIIAALAVLHAARLSHQAFVVLAALEVLLLCLRALYFCMAYEHFGALLRMVLLVIKVRARCRGGAGAPLCPCHLVSGSQRF